MSSRNSLPLLAFCAAGLLGARGRARPRRRTRGRRPGHLPADLLLPRPDRAHGVCSASASGAWKALRLLWVGGERRDLESYTWIHQGTIFGALTLITGSIWAKASWGVWWSWGSNQLVLFLVLFLFYCAYFMLRFSVDEGARRERICAVYALFGVALIPVSFFAIRLASDFIHPDGLHPRRPADDGHDVRHLPRLLGGDHPARLRDVSRSSSSASARTRTFASSARHCREPGSVRRARLRRRVRRSSSSGWRSSPRSSRGSSARPASSPSSRAVAARDG